MVKRHLFSPDDLPTPVTPFRPDRAIVRVGIVHHRPGLMAEFGIAEKEAERAGRCAPVPEEWMDRLLTWYREEFKRTGLLDEEKI